MISLYESLKKVGSSGLDNSQKPKPETIPTFTPEPKLLQLRNLGAECTLAQKRLTSSNYGGILQAKKS